MKITTGLEIVKEHLLKTDKGIRYVQDGLDYIEHLEKEVEKLKEEILTLKYYSYHKSTT